ncbi:hypothetical protein RhiirA4_478625 [Rhizophagus irregularis]|uniref:Uncharacterized protein n=1 Tax=Rhizophagus irregularis TaxID=588596 RepID=A0A2I1HF61_9GLOM|nr:hypothetical protein RhiirA4_475311 [Rhizophagus irregularis]PKY57512.1 hypothetical protein RhiirA4_478625 [Rhizophagus irregularis]
MENLKIFTMKYIDEVMYFDDFNLYWKKHLIPGGLRALREFDLNRTLKFIRFDFEEHLLNEEKHEKVKLLQNINFSFLKILYEKSEVLIGKEKYWELIRGVYNCKFNTVSKDKDEKEMMNELWMFCFDALKKEFWIKRCNEVNEIEQCLGIKKSDKRVRKLKDIESEDKNLENQKKN